MTKHLRIRSYFSLETDLAGEMCAWPEFVSGVDYDVELRGVSGDEFVKVRYIRSDEDAHVDITGSGDGSLFDRVAGRVIYAMSAHSDSLTINRHDYPAA